MQTNKTTKHKTYFLIPAMPTPNGRLHLGHIGGPFLAIDVLARHFRSAGHKTIVISGTDSFDSYITGQAVKENRSPEEICNNYHNLISNDLESMDIQFDRFINPLSKEWFQAFRKWHHHLLKKLQEAGVTEAKKEVVGLDDQTGRYLTGCWLPGLCPVCAAAVCGYFCEDCGAHFRPEQVVDAPKTSVKKEVSNLFMQLPESSDLDGRGIQQSILDVYKKFKDVQKEKLRLTANSEWGMSIGNDQIGDKFFNYPFAYAYALMMGEIAAKMARAEVNALAYNSDLVTVAAFGIDNTIPVLGSIEGITASVPEYKQFDYYLVNHFLYLEGRKFSTSRRHAIWVDELINQNGASADIVRLLLCSIDLRDASGNLDIEDFNRSYNTTTDRVKELLVDGILQLPSIDFASNSVNASVNKITELFTELYNIQAVNLNPQEFRLSGAVSTVNDWLDFGKQLDARAESYFWWLKGFAILAYPFMPRLTQILWTKLGYEGLPAAACFATAPTLPVQRDLPANLAHMDRADISNLAGATLS